MEIRDCNAEIVQVTFPPLSHTVLYPETPVFTPDSRYFVYTSPKGYWVCDTETMETRQLTVDENAAGLVVTYDGKWLIFPHCNANESEIRRISLDTFKEERLFTIPYKAGGGHLSGDGRYFVVSAVTGEDETGIVVVDLEKETCELIVHKSDIFNPHAQIDPKGGEWVLVQENTGGKWSSKQGIVKLYDEGKGVHLFVVSRKTKEVQHLNVGYPHTDDIQGHHCYTGISGKILTTTHPKAMADIRFNPWPQTEEIFNTSNLLKISVEENEPREIAPGHYFRHPGGSANGKYWTADAYGEDGVFVGSVETGEYFLLAHSQASMKAMSSGQNGHLHPTISPSGEYVIFNSDRDGSAQVYLARTEKAILDKLGAG